MNITSGLIYWISRLDGLCNLFMAVAIILGLATFVMSLVCAMAKFDGDEDTAVQMLRIIRVTFPVAAIAILLRVFTPTKEEMAAIIVIPKIANSETVSEIGDSVKTLAAEWLEELRPNKKEEAK